MAHDSQYARLASVYEFTTPAALMAPEGSFAAFSSVVADVVAGAPVLDCACGTGELAVGLAGAGFAVTATDASPEMVERAAVLAERAGAFIQPLVVPWEGLSDQGWDGHFRAVFCVGNSLMHAAGTDARRQALQNMAAVTAPGGRVAITSRNWELVRAAGSGIEIAPSILERNGRRGILIHNWVVAESWEQQHDLHVAVALLGADGHEVSAVSEHLTFWPFRHEQLLAELQDAGFTIEHSTYEPSVDRYLVTALRAS